MISYRCVMLKLSGYYKDQLSQARARASIKMKANSESPSTRLEGFLPKIEDWHTKLTLFEVGYKKIIQTLLYYAF